MSSSIVHTLNRAATVPPPLPTAAATADATAAARDAIYHVPRRFAPNSKLHNYLAEKCPSSVYLQRSDYNLYVVLMALKKVIATEKLFDPQNPTIILCDQALENAIDVKALHVSEIKEQVCKQFHPILRSDETVVDLSAALPQSVVHLGGQSPNLSHASPEHILIPNNSAPSQTSYLNSAPEPVVSETNPLTRCNTAPPTVVIRLAAPTPASQTSTPLQDLANPVLPSWASSTANAVMARINAAQPFDLEAKYWVKPAFLKVLRSVEGVNKKQLVFPYREVSNILSKYIVKNKDRFFDLRNVRVALVDNDPLGEAFGVKAFARTQVTALLRSQLTLYNENQCAPRADDGTEPKDSDDQMLNKRKRNSDVDSETEVQPSTSRAVTVAVRKESSNSTKRQRRKSRNVSVTIVRDCSTSEESSGGETIYSAQGYETAAVCDVFSDSDESEYESGSSQRDGASSPNRQEDDNDDDEYCEANVYRVEYEIDDGTSDEDDEKGRDKEGSSDDDSDIEDAVVASAVTELLNDMESTDFYRADSDSEFLSDDSCYNAHANYDPELQIGVDVWKCVNCGLPNTPYMRYCHRCWEERKGWVPERSNPRRRKKEKNSEGITAAKSQSKSSEPPCKTDDIEEPCTSKSIRLERSLSHPVAGTSAEHDTQVLAASDGEMDDKEGDFGNLKKSGTKSVESLGTGSQSSDSGFSQGSQEDGSQEILSQSIVLKNEIDGKMDVGGGEVEIASDGSLSTDSGTELEQDEGLDKSTRKRNRKKKQNCKTQNIKNGGKMSVLLNNRRDEVPTSAREPKFGASKPGSSSVCPTPQTDSCSSVSGESQSQNSAICNLCCVRPKDACFIHGKISHQVCCYPCAKNIFKRRGTCPVCRRRIEKITRNIVH